MILTSLAILIDIVWCEGPGLDYIRDISSIFYSLVMFCESFLFCSDDFRVTLT